MDYDLDRKLKNILKVGTHHLNAKNIEVNYKKRPDAIVTFD